MARRLPRAAALTLRFAREKPLGTIGGVIILGLLVMAVFADRIAPYAYDESIARMKQNPYIEAARAIGAGHARVILCYVLPNVMATILILATIGLGTVILAEAGLSFLGFGIPPPYPSWGGMLSGSGRTFMYYAPWMALFPGVAISLAVFGFNMLGDALRDVLDPRLRGASSVLRA